MYVDMLFYWLRGSDTDERPRTPPASDPRLEPPPAPHRPGLITCVRRDPCRPGHRTPFAPTGANLATTSPCPARDTRRHFRGHAAQLRASKRVNCTSRLRMHGGLASPPQRAHEARLCPRGGRRRLPEVIGRGSGQWMGLGALASMSQVDPWGISPRVRHARAPRRSESSAAAGRF